MGRGPALPAGEGMRQGAPSWASGAGKTVCLRGKAAGQANDSAVPLAYAIVGACSPVVPCRMPDPLRPRASASNVQPHHQQHCGAAHRCQRDLHRQPADQHHVRRCSAAVSHAAPAVRAKRSVEGSTALSSVLALNPGVHLWPCRQATLSSVVTDANLATLLVVAGLSPATNVTLDQVGWARFSPPCLSFLSGQATLGTWQQANFHGCQHSVRAVKDWKQKMQGVSMERQRGHGRAEWGDACAPAPAVPARLLQPAVLTQAYAPPPPTDSSGGSNTGVIVGATVGAVGAACESGAGHGGRGKKRH